MNYAIMLVSFALMFLCKWLGFHGMATWLGWVGLVTLFEIIVTDAVAAGIRKAKEQ